MPLDSDTQNADAQLHVEFFVYKEEGSQWDGKPHVRIFTPGDQTNRPVFVVTEQHKRRFPVKWLAFQMSQGGDAQLIGTPVHVWRAERPEDISENQLAELAIQKFMTVEQLAMAGDNQLLRVMGGVGLREKARSFISGKNAKAGAAELDKAKDEIAMLKAAVEKLVALSAASQPAPEKSYAAGAARRGGKPRGRPPKKKVTPHGEQHSSTADAISL